MPVLSLLLVLLWLEANALARADVFVALLLGVTAITTQLVVDATQVAASQILLVPALAPLEHHLVKHLVVLLSVSSHVWRCISPKVR